MTLVNNKIKSKLGLLAVIFILVATAARAQDLPDSASAPTDAASSGAAGNNEAAKADELAMKLQNPIASLISVPFQSNYDFGGGPAGNGFQFKMNLQPVIPISLNQDWNLISRTILPVVSQDDIIGSSSQSGLSDALQSFFFSPAKPTRDGWIWGAGPVFMLPTATDHLLGAEKWGAGPTGIVLKQNNGWTYGALANQIWSFAGESDRADVNATFLQPFVSYTTKTKTSFMLNTESTYDWVNAQWTVPVNFMLQQVVKIGNQPVAFQLGYRYYADKPDNGPDWGLRFAVIFLFPK
jgi:hypothetical protein